VVILYAEPTYLLLQELDLVDVLQILFDFRADFVNLGEDGHLRDLCGTGGRTRRVSLWRDLWR